VNEEAVERNGCERSRFVQVAHGSSPNNRASGFIAQEHFMSTLASLIRPHVQAELDAASSAEARGQFQTAFRHLERAHVLSQVCTRQHVRVHWRFLRFALRHDRGADAAGQLWRLAGAALLTAVGLVPAGNTGGSNVNGFRRMGVASDLQRVIDDARAASVPPRRRLAVPPGHGRRHARRAGDQRLQHAAGEP
jgi:hypothetical protein